MMRLHTLLKYRDLHPIFDNGNFGVLRSQVWENFMTDSSIIAFQS